MDEKAEAEPKSALDKYYHCHQDNRILFKLSYRSNSTSALSSLSTINEFVKNLLRVAR